MASLSNNDQSLMYYEHFVTPKYGNCYTLLTRNELLGKSSLTGADYGLSLVLNIEHDTYLRGGQSMVSYILNKPKINQK